MANSAARVGVTYLGLAGYMTKPMASAPIAAAASTSSSRVSPQILIRVRPGAANSLGLVGESIAGSAVSFLALMATNHKPLFVVATGIARRR